MSEPSSGLVPYSGRRKSFADDLLKSKSFRDSVRDGASTDSMSLEKRRARVGAIEKVVDGNLSKVRDLQAAAKDADKEELAQIQQWQWVQRVSFSTAVGSYLFSLIASAGD